jgi:hypothetical protein
MRSALEIDTRLVPILMESRDSVKTARVIPSAPNRTGEGHKEAAKGVSKSMKWKHLEAHARVQ